MWFRSLFAHPTTLGEAEARDAHSMIAAGVGMTALAAVEIAAGSVCPVCVVAAPALLGVGAYKRWRARRMMKLNLHLGEQDTVSPHKAPRTSA